MCLFIKCSVVFVRVCCEFLARNKFSLQNIDVGSYNYRVASVHRILSKTRFITSQCPCLLPNSFGGAYGYIFTCIAFNSILVVNSLGLLLSRSWLSVLPFMFIYRASRAEPLWVLATLSCRPVLNLLYSGEILTECGVSVLHRSSKA